jgi:hypothetical protein
VVAAAEQLEEPTGIAPGYLIQRSVTCLDRLIKLI